MLKKKIFLTIGFIFVASFSYANEVERVIQVWDSFAKEVANNNIEGALQYISEGEFKRIFRPILYANREKFFKKRDLEIIYIRENEAKLHYKEEPFRDLIFLDRKGRVKDPPEPIFTDIYFEKDSKGQWKIKSILSWSKKE